jgi:hypothetical protein
MDQMSDCHHRVAPDHAWSGVTHHFPDLLSHVCFVTVYGAVLTGGFLDPERAFRQPFLGVVPELSTFFAELISPMFSSTINADHRPQCCAFLFDIDHETSKNEQKTTSEVGRTSEVVLSL